MNKQTKPNNSIKTILNSESLHNKVMHDLKQTNQIWGHNLVTTVIESTI